LRLLDFKGGGIGMRIISQDGRYDLPYEYEVIALDRNNETVINAYDVGCDDGAWTIAKYSTKSKAIKALKMLHEVYEHGKYIPYPKLDKNKIAKDDDMTLYNHEMAEKLFPSGFHSQVKVFQFPQDDEIEV
jgi:hypothetical protein